MKVTIQEAKQAYDEIGYTPEKWITVDHERKKCCVLGAIFLSETNNKKADTAEIFAWGYSKYGQFYCRGLTLGFDGISNRLPDEEEQEGFQDGVTIFRELEKDLK